MDQEGVVGNVEDWELWWSDQSLISILPSTLPPRYALNVDSSPHTSLTEFNLLTVSRISALRDGIASAQAIYLILMVFTL